MKNKKKIKIVFFGTFEFGKIVLEKLIEKELKPCLVITPPDKPVGRKRIISPPPVKTLALQYNIPVLQDEKIVNLLPEIKEKSPDLGIVADFGKIIPKEILEIPKYGILNLHPSLLPKYRGPSPIQSAIIEGEKKTGISIILMDEKIDHGPILATKEVNLPKNIDFQNLREILAKTGAETLIKVIPQWINGKIKPKKQNHSKATFTKIIKREDGKINWTESAEKIERKLRALSPWPGVFTFWNGKRLKILKAQSAKAPIKKKKPGTVFLFKDKVGVFCKKGVLILKEVQLEGKKPTDIMSFIRGYRNFVGSEL